MKLLALAVVLSVGMVAFAAEKAGEGAKDAKKAPTTQKVATSQPVNKFCAVNQDEAIDPHGETVVYKGKTIGFCCDDCIPKFQKDPEKYMKTLK